MFFALGAIEEHPASVTVPLGEWAKFNCSVNCSERVSLRWRLVAPKMGEINDRFCKIRALQRLWEKKGITLQHESTTSEYTGCKIVTLKILTTSQLDTAVLQCAAIATRRHVTSSYSKFAVVQVLTPLESV